MAHKAILLYVLRMKSFDAATLLAYRQRRADQREPEKLAQETILADLVTDKLTSLCRPDLLIRL